MVTFRNNNRRNSFRKNDRIFKNNIPEKKILNNFNGNENFSRKNNRGNHNAPKLFEKYINLAREALSSGDKILSENYFQHADHFKRIMNENDVIKKVKSENENISLIQKETKDISHNNNNLEKKNEDKIIPQKN